MTLLIETQPLPLIQDSDGVVRISGTRVTLDTVILAFLDGATAEEIVQQYPSLSLPDIYSVIGYYLNRSDQVNRYLEHRKKLAEEIKKQNETQFDPDGIRNRLLARRSS
ncbi:MAG: DUF433 domain-containing protein [Anaerolineales bacterium]|nr:DUF433 domain-containing protein [Anaerolineales bacterium]